MLPAPTADILKVLQNHGMEWNYDLEIATNGNVDRQGPVVRNLSTTHRLDKVSRRFGQVCYEVSVGFQYIFSKMAETKAILGGESFGGLTVAGYINGKKGIYAAFLLVEMMAVTGE